MGCYSSSFYLISAVNLTGATSHVTPCHIEIKLADGSSVYSHSKGTILFEPVIGDQILPRVQSSDVLYVPDLMDNLFSVLSLRKGFTITCPRQYYGLPEGTAIPRRCHCSHTKNSQHLFLHHTSYGLGTLASLPLSSLVPCPQEDDQRGLDHWSLDHLHF